MAKYTFITFYEFKNRLHTGVYKSLSGARKSLSKLKGLSSQEKKLGLKLAKEYFNDRPPQHNQTVNVNVTNSNTNRGTYRRPRRTSSPAEPSNAHRAEALTSLISAARDPHIRAFMKDLAPLVTKHGCAVNALEVLRTSVSAGMTLQFVVKALS
jgi:hypothetical protein